MDANGRFTSQVPDFKGQAVKEADNDICAHLKANGRLVLKEVYFHSYPFCWRSETPLIYKAVPSWFVAVEKVKSQLLANNAQTYWVPSFVQVWSANSVYLPDLPDLPMALFSSTFYSLFSARAVFHFLLFGYEPRSNYRR